MCQVFVLFFFVLWHLKPWRPLVIISSLCVSDFRVRGFPCNVITYLLEYNRGVTPDQVEGKLNMEKKRPSVASARIIDVSGMPHE